MDWKTKKTFAKAADNLSRGYVLQIQRFLSTLNPIDLERSLYAKLNRTIDEIIENKVLNSSSIIQILPRYVKNMYSEPIKVSWFDPKNRVMSKNISKNLGFFKRAYVPFEHRLVMDLFHKLIYLCAKHNMEFQLSDGSLIGTLRHFDLIPWDDDAVSEYIASYIKFKANLSF